MPKRSSSHAPLKPLSVAAPGRELRPHHASKRGQTLAQKSAGEVKHPQPCFRGTSSVNATSTHCTHSDRTPGGVTAGGSTNAGAIDHVITGTACMADLRDHTVRPMKRRRRHGLRRCCDGQGKGNSDQPDHWFSPCLSLRGEKTPSRYTRLDASARLARAPGREKTGANRPHLRLDGGDYRRAMWLLV
jgi:hypothetical protein